VRSWSSETGALLCARLHPDGRDPHMFFGAWIPVPKHVRAGLLRRRLGDSVARCVVKPRFIDWPRKCGLDRSVDVTEAGQYVLGSRMETARPRQCTACLVTR
jgi:hypothetical protein